MQNEINNICLKDKSRERLFGTPDKYDYSKFSNLDEFDWDNELMEKFSPIAQKLNLSQESLDMLLDIALEMSRKQKDLYEKDEKIKLDDEMALYNKMFNEDSELPRVNSIQYREYMSIADDAYSELCSPKLKELLTQKGLTSHPEVIKFFYKIGELIKEDDISYNGKPPVEELTPAQILYGVKN